MPGKVCSRWRSEVKECVPYQLGSHRPHGPGPTGLRSFLSRVTISLDLAAGQDRKLFLGVEKGVM